MKTCYVCKTAKPLDSFAVSKRERDGRQAKCRGCTAEYRRNHKPLINAASQRHRGTPQQRATRAAWLSANAEKVREQRRARYEGNKSRSMDYVQGRRARLATVEREDVDRQIVWERDEGICRLCGLAADPANWHLEHLTPLIRGGSHTYGNVAVSHPLCNREKWQMTLEEWMAR